MSEETSIFRETGRECPRCGEQGFDALDFPEWEKEITTFTIACTECELYVKGEIDTIPENYSTTCVSCLNECRPIQQERGKGFLCENCTNKEIIFDGDFGVVIPSETGKVWQNQTGGVLCSRRWIEGEKIFLGRPESEMETKEQKEKYSFDSEWRNDGDILAALTDANYENNLELADEIWEDLNEKLPFEYEEVEAPDNQMSQTEAFKWIKITEVDDKSFNEENKEKLLDQTVVLHYPNCD